MIKIRVRRFSFTFVRSFFIRSGGFFFLCVFTFVVWIWYAHSLLHSNKYRKDWYCLAIQRVRLRVDAFVWNSIVNTVQTGNYMCGFRSVYCMIVNFWLTWKKKNEKRKWLMKKIRIPTTRAKTQLYGLLPKYV